MKNVKKLLALALMIGGLCFMVSACQKAETPAPAPEPARVEQPAPPAPEAPATTTTAAAPAAAPAADNAATTR